MNKVGIKIKKLRELKNFTQEYMASHLDMTPSGYGKIERDESDVSLSKLDRIAEVLGIKVEDILNFNESLVFNVMHNQNGNGYVVNSGVSSKEGHLYEQLIMQLRQENETLKQIIIKLQG